MARHARFIAAICIVLFSLTSCSYNPFLMNNRLTGNPMGAAVGAGAFGGSVALLGGSKTLIALTGIMGGAAGYYATTLRFAAGEIIAAGGKVYKVGDYIGIYLPTDHLFEPNTDELLPQAKRVLQSTAVLLKRYPQNNIIISGNTSGFGRSGWELKLSERRAQRVSAYLWSLRAGGVMCFPESAARKLNYVGYGDYFPIAHHYTNESIRVNSRLQIVSYPPSAALVGRTTSNDVNQPPCPQGVCQP